MPLILVLLLAVAGSPPAVSQAPSPARVFVTTSLDNPSNDLTARRQSVKDVSEALASKKKDVLIVQDQAQADLVVTIVDRSVTTPRVVLGLAPPPGPSGMATPRPATVPHLTVTLTRGTDDPIEIRNKNTAYESSGGWKSAAGDVAKQIDAWIVAHRSGGLIPQR